MPSFSLDIIKSCSVFQCSIIFWATAYSCVCPVDLASYILCWLRQGDQGLRGPAGNPGKEGPKVSHPKSQIREKNRVIRRRMSPRYIHRLPFSCNSFWKYNHMHFFHYKKVLWGKFFINGATIKAKHIVYIQYSTVPECETFSDRQELRPKEKH